MLPEASAHRWWHTGVLLLATASTAFSVAFIVGEVLIVVFEVSPRTLGDFSTFGPGSQALSDALKGPLGPDVPPSSDSKPANPMVDRAVREIVREIMWLRSPWRFALNNIMAISVMTVLFPWVGLYCAKRSSKDKDRVRYLWATLLFAPLVFHVGTQLRIGLWVAAKHINRGEIPYHVLRHGIPELLACFLCALIPMHYYLRHVRSGSPTTFRRYSLRHLGTYAISGGLVILAAFIEAGQVRF